MTTLSTAARLYPYRILLDLPVCHLTQATRDWMQIQARETAENGTEGGSVLDIGSLPHGWYLRVRTDIGDRIPADLDACMQKAAALGAHSILFDTDADLSPITGDLPVYDENARDAVIAREDYEGLQIDPHGPATGVIAVDVLVCVATDEESHIPCLPSVYGNERLSEMAFRNTLKREWEAQPPEEGEDDTPMPFPEEEDNDTIHDRMAAHHGSSWGQYKLTSEYVPLADLLTRGLSRPDPTPVVAIPTGPRILATITPQAWVNDHAVDVDPEGETSWDVTEEIVALGRDAALAMRDNRDESDHLTQSKNAPQWVKDWGGPYYVTVEDAIQSYYDALDASEQKLAA